MNIIKTQKGNRMKAIPFLIDRNFQISLEKQHFSALLKIFTPQLIEINSTA